MRYYLTNTLFFSNYRKVWIIHQLFSRWAYLDQTWVRTLHLALGEIVKQLLTTVRLKRKGCRVSKASVNFLRGRSKRALISDWLILNGTKFLSSKCNIVSRTLLYCVLFLVFFGLSSTFTIRVSESLIYGAEKWDCTVFMLL